MFLFVIICFLCWAVSVRIERGPWTCCSFRWFACFALVFFACCFVSNYSFLLDQLLLIVFIFVFAFAFCCSCCFADIPRRYICDFLFFFVKYSTHHNALNFVNRVNETDSPLNRTTNISRLCAMLVFTICFH